MNATLLFFRQRGPFVVLLITLGILTLYLWPRVQSYPGGSDSSGYLHNARLLHEGRLKVPYRAIGELPFEAFRPQIYTPLGFVLDPGSTEMMPTYPFGVSLVFATTGTIFGMELGTHIAIAGIALLSVLGVFALIKELTDSGWLAVAGAIALSVSAVFVFMAAALMSDALTGCLAVWCLLFAIRVERNGWYPIGVGASFALIVITRLPNAILLIPLCFALGKALRRGRIVVPIVLSGMPGAIFLAVTNKLIYGSIFASGYRGHEDFFKFEHFPKTLAFYAEWVTNTLSPILVIGFLLSALFVRRRPREIGMIWLWAGSFLILYAFYFHTSQVWWYLRFVLPAYPALIAGAALTSSEIFSWLGRRWPLMGRFPVVAVGLWVFAFAIEWKWTDRLVTTGLKRDNEYVRWTDWAEKNLPEDAIIACMQLSGHAFYEVGNPILRYDWLEEKSWQTVQDEASRRGLSIYAPLFHFEIEELKALDRMPGDWELVEKFGWCSIYRLRVD